MQYPRPVNYQIAARKVRPIFVHSDGRDDGTVLAVIIGEKSMRFSMDDINVLSALSNLKNLPERILKTPGYH